MSDVRKKIKKPMWKTLVKKIFCYRIMVDILLVYAFSRTPLFLIYLLLLIFGFFPGEQGNLFNFYCMIFVSYINGTSFFLCIVFISNKMRKWVEPIITSSFLKRFLPNKGFYSWLILILSLLGFIFIEVFSIKYLVDLKLQQASQAFQASLDFIDLDEIDNAIKENEKGIEISETIPSIKGYISQLALHPFMLSLRSLLCGLFGLQA